MLDFPAHALMQFFENHALLNYEGQHQWYTVEGGSVQYVSRLEAAMRRLDVDIRLSAPVEAVRRPGLGEIDLTYWMNSLQPIPKSDPLFVTLNCDRPIREELIYDQTTFRHPVYDLDALDGQREIAAMNGTNNTWFCGAWMKNGFHEDGLSSAVDVIEGMRDADALPVAAQ